MIEDITVGRAVVSPAVCEPVQWSSNLEVAVNNGDQISLLRPGIPLIHKSILKWADKERQIVILNTKNLFEIASVLDAEKMDRMNLANMDKIIINTLNEEFSLGKISMPLIVSHKWAPLHAYSRDCYLGVLLNTSELLVLERSGIEQVDFSVKFNVLMELIAQLELTHESYSDGQISMKSDQYLSLKVKAFCFSQISEQKDSHQMLALATADQGISIHIIGDKLTRILSFRTGGQVVKMEWSEWFVGEDKPYSYLSVVSESNEITTYRIFLEISSGTLTLNNEISLKKSSRYLISNLKFIIRNDKIFLLAVSTQALHIFSIRDFNSIGNAVYKLKFNSLAAGIIEYFQDNENIGIQLAYEIGKFEALKINLKTLEVSSISSLEGLTKFVSSNLYQFQISNSKSDEPEEIVDNYETTKLFLANNVEGKVNIYGVNAISEKTVAVVYRVFPRYVLNYTIQSKSDFRIGFIDFEDGKFLLDYDDGTSLSHLVRLWIDHYKVLPAFPKLQNNSSDNECTTFIEDLESFRRRFFVGVSDSSFEIFDFPDFKQFLFNNFTNNQSIRLLQHLLNFDVVALKSLEVLMNKVPWSSQLKDIIERTKEEQKLAQSKIFMHLVNLVLHFVSVNQIRVTSGFDKYLILSYFLIQSDSERKLPSSVPEEVDISLRTKFHEESFRVSTRDIVDDDFVFSATSTLGHKWCRCSLTLFPILGLRNGLDETKTYFYKGSRTEQSNESVLTNTLTEVVNYCIYTGNRTYEVS